jgi:hypothetical protein
MPLPLLIAALLVLSAALFGVGVAVENASGGETHASVAPSGTGGRTETGQEGSESTEHGESNGPGTGHPETVGQERVLGVSVESPATVVAAVVVSLLLAALVWAYPRPAVLVVVAVFAASAAVFDVAEVARQFSADRNGVGLLAVLVAALHVAVLAAAVVLLRPARRSSAT